MPIYKNTGSNIVQVDGKSFPPGVEVTTQKYINRPNFTLVSDNPKISPFVKLYSDTIANASGGITGMQEYDNMLVYNNTGALLTITANEDSSNTQVLPDNQFLNFILDRQWRRMDISGSGGGNLYVTVSKNI